VGARIPGGSDGGPPPAARGQSDRLGARARVARPRLVGGLALGGQAAVLARYRFPAVSREAVAGEGSSAPRAGGGNGAPARPRRGAYGAHPPRGHRRFPGRRSMAPRRASVAAAPGVQRHRGSNGGGRARPGSGCGADDGASGGGLRRTGEPGGRCGAASRWLAPGPCRCPGCDRCSCGRLGPMSRAERTRRPGRPRRGARAGNRPDLGRRVGGSRAGPAGGRALLLGDSLPNPGTTDSSGGRSTTEPR
jgi:hypothetical protein